MDGIYVPDSRGIEKAHPAKGNEIIEKDQLRLSGPRQGPHGDRGILRIGRIASTGIEIQFTKGDDVQREEGTNDVTGTGGEAAFGRL